MVKLKGLKTNVDIPIEIIGLRPGEKLYEEILMDEEGLEKTQNDLIYIGKPIELNEKSFLIQLEGLIEKALSNDSGIKEEVAKLCTTYTVTES